jgi:hypothetical protein
VGPCSGRRIQTKLIYGKPSPIVRNLSKGRASFAQVCKTISSRKTREKRNRAEQIETEPISYIFAYLALFAANFLIA